MVEAWSRVAILADIHGNAVALDAVLAECRVAGIDGFIVPGDVAWGPQPREAVERIMALGRQAIVVQGNADREVANPATVQGDAFLTESTEWCAAALSVEQRRWLEGLPLTATVRIAGLGDVLVCHGSPASDTGTLRPDEDPDAAAQLLAGVGQDLVVCGHTHVQFDRIIGPHRVVNPGSVGLHYGAPDALWAVLGPSGVSLRSTPYDRQRAARLAEQSGIPGSDWFVAFFHDVMPDD